MNCGDSPKYIVCDGKTDGPTKRKVEHLHELDRPEHDKSYLCQGSFFEDRVFLSDKRERAWVCNLLTNVISEEEFVESETITSSNGKLFVELVQWISLSLPDEIPKPYKRLLGNICKKAVWRDICRSYQQSPWNIWNNSVANPWT